MKINHGAVATLNYTLKVEGKMVDSTEKEGPIAYLHGVGDIFPKLEEALEGKEPGEKVSLTLGPEDSYGEYQEDLTDRVAKAEFEAQEELFIGQEFNFQTENGEEHSIWVREIGDEDVLIDGNHPLAGKTLEYSFEVVDVREATEEEKEHGHVHGEGGHQH